VVEVTSVDEVVVEVLDDRVTVLEEVKGTPYGVDVMLDGNGEVEDVEESVLDEE
jgi:hypothetical protein